MSFVGDDGHNLGCCIVEIDGLMAAAGGLTAAYACVRASREAGCNPGGEVLMNELPVIPPEAFRNRLMPPAEARVVAAEKMATWEKAA